MFNKVISILGTLILLVLAGCRDVAPISVEEPSTENRTITLNLDITTRADNLLPDNSEPDIIRLWICDMNDSIITSIVSSHNVWTPVEETDEEGIDITTTLQTEIEADDINEKSTFKIYLVLNQPFKDSTTPVDFTNVTSIKELKQQMFVLTEYKGDNKVPMTGEGTAKFSSVKGNKIIFSTSIYAKRCVAKLGIYCTKGNPSANSTLTINQVALSKVPDKGYLFKPGNYTSISYSDEVKYLFSGEKEISSYYTEDMPAYSNNSWDEKAETNFLEVSSSYLLENPNRVVTEDDGFLQVGGTVSDNDNRYCITLTYTLNETEYTKKIYVSQVERNQYSKIYIRINDATTINTCCQINSWTKHEMDVPAFE